MSGYISLAKFYDSLTKDYDYDKYYQFIKPYIGKSVVELGAGTGKFTLKYIGAVESVQFVEQSEEMLSIANGKLMKYRKKCNFITNDMKKFVPMHRVDTVLSICDGFNYVEDIEGLLDNIDSYLLEGGKIIFDISSEYKINNIICNNVFYEDGERITYLWTNKLIGNRVEMDVAIFEKTDSGLYRRSDDVSFQFAHKTDSIALKLKKMGYSVTIYDGDSFLDTTENSQRILFIAIKGGNENKS